MQSETKFIAGPNSLAPSRSVATMEEVGNQKPVEKPMARWHLCMN